MAEYRRIALTLCPDCRKPLQVHIPRLASQKKTEAVNGKVFETDETSMQVWSPKSRRPCSWKLRQVAYLPPTKADVDESNARFTEAFSYFVDRLKEAR
jgi:hypothetical protein